MSTQMLPDERADEAATKAHIALREGDTIAARKYSDEAGKLLLDQAKSANRAEEKHLLLFLAATQFYLGGNYQRSLEVARRIEARHLPGRHRATFDKFSIDLKARTRPDYAESLRRRMLENYRQRKYQSNLELMKAHPYLYLPADLAFHRSVLCHRVGDYFSAASLLKDANAFRNFRLNVLVGAAFQCLATGSAMGLDAARNAAEAYAKLFPHAVTFAVASLIYYLRGYSSTGGDQAKAYVQQADSLRLAKSKLVELSGDFRNEELFREGLALAFSSGAEMALRQRDRGAAFEFLRMCEEAKPTMTSTLVVIDQIKSILDNREGEFANIEEKEYELNELNKRNRDAFIEVSLNAEKLSTESIHQLTA